ncbi:MAG TPA: Yip1 family protein [Patescibacteria group bacterium]
MEFVKEIVKKAKLVLTKPKIFFEGAKKEDGIKDAFIYYAVLSLVGTILQTLAAVVLQGGKGLNIPALVVVYILTLLLIFIVIAIIHVWAKIFGGTGTFVNTYQLYVYSNTPKPLLNFIPIIGPLAGSIYALVIFVIGGTVMHKFSMKKSILVFAVPAVIITLLSIILAFAFVALLPTFLMSAANQQ